MSSANDLPPWPGDCFRRAAKVMIDSQDNRHIRLIHGEIPDSYVPGRRVVHAWCELPGTGDYVDERTGRKFKRPIIVCVDMTQPDEKARMLPQEIYYKHTRPKNVKRYTFAQMMERTVRHGHEGPWPD